MSSFTCRTVHYNASTSAFEACVDLVKSGKTLRFPCQVVGPVTMDIDVVKAGLRKDAQRQAQRGSPLMSHI